MWQKCGNVSPVSLQIYSSWNYEVEFSRYDLQWGKFIFSMLTILPFRSFSDHHGAIFCLRSARKSIYGRRWLFYLTSWISVLMWSYLHTQEFYIIFYSLKWVRRNFLQNLANWRDALPVLSQLAHAIIRVALSSLHHVESASSCNR